MNEDFTHRLNSQLNIGYYWEQFQPLIAAVAVLLLGWILALLLASAVKKLLHQFNTHHKLSNMTGQDAERIGHLNYEVLISKFVFWFIFIIVLITALNIFNINGVSGPLSIMIGQFLLFVPNLIAAVVVAFIAWLLARLLRTGLLRVLDKTRIDEKLSTEAGVTNLSKNIAEMVYWLVLLLFLPMILAILGLSGLLAPVQNMLNDAIGFVPNIFIAAVIICVGYILAKIVRSIVEGLSQSFQLQQCAEKVGLFKQSNLSHFLGTFVFAIVMITTLIIAFDALGIRSISDPATVMLSELMLAIPHLLAAALILIVAYVVSRFVAQLITALLAGTGVDQIPAKLEIQRYLGESKVSILLGHLIVFFTMLFAVSEAASRLGLTQVRDLIAMFIHFGANILLGTVIFIIGFWLASIVASVVQRGEQHGATWLANLIRTLIIGLVLAMGLKAMGIADSIVNLAFGLTLGAVAVAFALAFGLGGRRPAERVLTDLIDCAKKQNCDRDQKSSELDLVKHQSSNAEPPSQE